MLFTDDQFRITGIVTPFRTDDDESQPTDDDDFSTDVQQPSNQNKFFLEKRAIKCLL